MERAKPFIAFVCVFFLLAPGVNFAADKPVAPGARDTAKQPGYTAPPDNLLGKFESPYRPKPVPPPNLDNTSRMDSLMRAGNLYLSMQDAIALALENNLDIAIERYVPQIADTGLLSARAGGNARTISNNINTGTTSSAIQNFTSFSSSAATSGPAIPNLDPTLAGNYTWAHVTTPQSSAFVTGTNALIATQKTSGVSIQKGFMTGTSVSLGLSNTNVFNNSVRADINPYTNGSLSFSLTQHLLQGFGPGVNDRQIRIARNNREISDLTFKLQVETTVAAVMDLYWNLVSYNQAVQVARNAVAASQRLLENNKAQVAVGTLAPIEVTRAEAELATNQQNLTVAEMRVLQQETVIKNALSRTGITSPAVASARVILMDQISVPDVEPISPIQDMTGLALASRPELAQSRIQIQNQLIALRGSKNGLLPTLDLVAGLSNNALAGELNTLPGNHNNVPFFIGGYGKVLSQLFSRNFPNYSAGFSLSVPIRNRSAQSQVINDQLTLRQQQLSLQRMENQVRTEVQNALIALTQARAQYQAASKAVVLQQQTLDAEQQKLDLGASTIYNVILAERDLTTARSNLVSAETAYATAKVEMDRATGQILYNNSISIEEAFQGKVSRPPSRIPDNPPAPQPQQ